MKVEITQEMVDKEEFKDTYVKVDDNSEYPSAAKYIE